MNSKALSSTHVKWLITILISAAIYLIPLTELYTASLRIFLIVTVFSILLVAFDLGDSLIAGIVLFMGYSVTKIAEPSVIFAAWSNDVAWMLIGSLVLVAAIEETGVMNRLVCWMVKKLGGSYTKMLWAIYLACLLVAFLTSCMCGPLVAVIVLGICRGMKYAIGSKEANGVVFAAMTGTLAPMGWMYNPINGGVGTAVLKMFDPSSVITWFSYLEIGLPWLAFDLIWMVLITKVFFKPSVNHIDIAYFENELAKRGKLNNSEKKAICLLLIVVIYLLSAGSLGWNTNYAFSILGWAVFLPGINLANAQTLKKINFGVVFFTVGCLAIGNVGNAVGVGTLITAIVSPVLSGLSEFTYIFGIWIIATISNLLLTPVAVSTALGVPLMQIGLELGIDPIATLFTVLMNTSNVFMPHENSLYLLYFALGLFTMKDFVKYNAIRMGMHLIFMMAIIVPYWHLIGIL